ncbi:MAG: pitrilysin family protein [Armatimonadota bacterium]
MKGNKMQAKCYILLFIIFIVIFACTSSSFSQTTGIYKDKLDNEVTLITKPEHGTGLVAIIAAVKVGSSNESFQTAGIGNFVAQLLLAGTALSSAEEVALIAESVGGNIIAQSHFDFTEIRIVTTSEMFNKSMKLIGESLTQLVFEHKWVEQTRNNLKSKFLAQDSNYYEIAYQQLRELLYEDNSYRRTPLGSERVIANTTIADLQKYYSYYYVPNNIIITVVGDISREHALDQTSKAFAGVPTAKLPLQRPIPNETLSQNRLRVLEADIPVAYLMVGWHAPSVTEDDYYAAAVATNALGGGKGSYMFRELRQKEGIAYDLGVQYPMLKYQSHILSYILTNPFKISYKEMKVEFVMDYVQKILLEQITKLQNEPLSDTDLKRAKGYTIGSYLLSHQRMIDRAFRLAWLESIGLGYDFYDSFPEKIEKVTAADVQRVSNKYFRNYAAVLLLPSTKVQE